MQGLGSRIGFKFRIQGFRVQGGVFRDGDLGQGLEFKFRVWGLGFRVLALRFRFGVRVRYDASGSRLRARGSEFKGTGSRG